MLTVLFATRDRSRVLHSVLESFCGLHAPSCGWKLVVVDNGSTDQTREVINSFANRLPLQSLTEPKKGKNFALNTGLTRVEGDLTVLTDDDVFPNEDWLLQLSRAADARPDFSIFGGSIVPRWEVAPPDWTRWADQGAAYAITEPSWKKDRSRQIASGGRIWRSDRRFFSRALDSIRPSGPKGAITFREATRS